MYVDRSALLNMFYKVFVYFGFASFVYTLVFGLPYNFFNDIFFYQKFVVMINPVYQVFFIHK